jgi:hypothetical protein
MTTPDLPERLVPEQPNGVVIEADWTARRDTYGRTRFFAWWWPGRFWAPDQPSGQCFHASPEEYLERWQAEARPVRVEQLL